jgi:hypothetical protein
MILHGWVKRLGGVSELLQGVGSEEKCRRAPHVKAPTHDLHSGHLYRSAHYATRLPTLAAGPDAVHRAASLQRASTWRTGKTSTVLRLCPNQGDDAQSTWAWVTRHGDLCVRVPAASSAVD